jgi:hypothetical protein
MTQRSLGRVWLVGALASCALGGCSDTEPRKTFVGSADTGPVGVEDAAGSDAGRDDDDAGAPSADARHCVRVNPTDAMNEDLPFDQRASGISEPSDFVVTRQVARWSGSCDNPKLLIKLSEGICPNGNGHELVLTLAKQAFDDGALSIGENILQTEPDETRVRARYTRPKDVNTSTPERTWGTCKGSTGQLALPDLPNFQRASELSARFIFNLSSCTSEAQEPQPVIGAFNVEVPAFVDHCAGADAGSL